MAERGDLQAEEELLDLPDRELISVWRKDCGMVHWQETKGGLVAPLWGILSNRGWAGVKMNMLEKDMHTTYAD